MQELIEAGLFGKGLIDIEDSMLIKRYNACLTDMGLPLTKLKKIKIDRLGWSPEVAAELGDERYLSHGEANPCAIALTPRQKDAPIFYPHHSFDWRLMDGWYAQYATQIADVTKDTGIWLDIDQDVSLYQSPLDLTMVDEVIIRAHTPIRIIKGAIEQKDLVRRFIAEEDAHMDAELIALLQKSREEFGDLRHRSLVIRDYQFSDVKDFYSRALGGVFVFRSKNSEPLIICRDVALAEQYGLFPVTPELLGVLKEHGYVTHDLAWWREHLGLLDVLAESFLMDVLDVREPKLEFLSLNSAKQKAMIQRYRGELQVYQEVLQLKKRLSRNEKKFKVSDTVSALLLHPAADLSKASQEVIGQLMTRINGGRFVPYFYRHHKTEFVEAYTKKWNAPRREWARVRIREYYELASKSSAHLQ
jgi:hypothetical protein